MAIGSNYDYFRNPSTGDLERYKSKMSYKEWDECAGSGGSGSSFYFESNTFNTDSTGSSGMLFIERVSKNTDFLRRENEDQPAFRYSILKSGIYTITATLSIYDILDNDVKFSIHIPINPGGTIVFNLATGLNGNGESSASGSGVLAINENEIDIGAFEFIPIIVMGSAFMYGSLRLVITRVADYPDSSGDVS